MINKLNTKLSLALLVILLFVGSVAMIIALRSIQLYYEELTQKINANLAMYVTESWKQIESDPRHVEAFKILAKRAMIINPAVEVYLLDTTGRVVAHALQDGELMREHINLDPIRLLIYGGAEYPIKAADPRHANVDKIFSASEIIFNNRLKGYLYVVVGGKSYDDIGQDIVWSHIGSQMFWSLLTVIAGSTLIGLFIFHRLIQRLNRLTDQMTCFAKSELKSDRLPDSYYFSGDEVDRIEQVFHGMSERISLQLEQLRSTDKLRRELISNVSHDLRTPLATIQGYIETLLLKDDALNQTDRLTFLRSAEKGCGRLSRLIADLFELSRLESGNATPEPEHFSLAELMFDTAQGFKLPLQGKNISLDIRCPDNNPVIYADIGMIQRVFDNLLRNAIAHTPDNGNIHIHLTETEKGVNVTVSDTGYGISEQDLPNIFDRHYQSSLKGNDKSSSGSGLGLTIVKRILEIHGSHIEVQSQRYSGTQFRFTLPG